MQNTMINTITPDRAANILRDTGMKTTADTIRMGIEQGVFPFGIVIRTRSSNPVYYVFPALLEKWIKERSTESNATYDNKEATT